MEDHDDICLCFHVPVCKVRKYMERTEPEVASQLSECLGVGTACGWCRPFLEKMHRQWKDGDKIEVHAEKSSYANCREAWKARERRTGEQ